LRAGRRNVFAGIPEDVAEQSKPLSRGDFTPYVAAVFELDTGKK
jgi:hypothetical protein